jgi:hypothetical protein
MKVVLNVHDEVMASQVCIMDLHSNLQAAGVEAVLNDWDHYDKYDVVVFMGHDAHLEDAVRQNPTIRVAVADPKLSQPEYIEAARSASFLMVSSVEQRDVFLKLNRNILVYHMFPQIESVQKVHQNGDRIVVGYHGNRVHLECMQDGAGAAIRELGRRRRVEFWAMYNRDTLGEVAFPGWEHIRVRHIQWSWQNYVQELAHVDIGIVPNLMPIRDRLRILELSAYRDGRFMYEPFDHLCRFKASTNPGRLYPFARLGIPVVTDFTPSGCQFVLDGESGFVSASPHAWFEALETLAASPVLRNGMAAQFRKNMLAAERGRVSNFIEFCSRDLHGDPVEFCQTLSVEQELGRLDKYKGPSGQSLARRFMYSVKNRLQV